MTQITLQTTLREFQLEQRVRELEHRLARAESFSQQIATAKAITDPDILTVERLPEQLVLYPVSQAWLSFGPLGWQVQAQTKSSSSDNYLAIGDYIEPKVISQLSLQQTGELLVQMYARGLGLVRDLMEGRQRGETRNNTTGTCY